MQEDTKGINKVTVGLVWDEGLRARVERGICGGGDNVFWLPVMHLLTIPVESTPRAPRLVKLWSTLRSSLP